jgi:RNA polymerase sigma factor (sigma-70 family)
MNEQNLITSLNSDNVEKTFRKLYRYYPKVEHFVLANSGNKHDALDTFQEALIVLYNKVQNDNFKLTSTLETYLFSVAKLVWMNSLRRKKANVFINFEIEDKTIDVEEKEVNDAFVQKALSEIGERCKELLILFYFRSLSMVEIAQKMSFKTINSAKTQKYKCIEKARNKVLELQEFTNHFNA